MGFFSEISRVQFFMVTRHIMNTSAKKCCHFDQNLLSAAILNAWTQKLGVKILKMTISRSILVVRGWFCAHFMQNPHVLGGVLCNIYLSDQPILR